MHVLQEKAKADAYSYSILQEAEANQILLTPEYLRVALYKSLANNITMYFGESIPKVFYSDLGKDLLNVKR